MTTEARVEDLSSLTVKDLANISRSEIKQLAAALPDLRREPDEIKRASSNVDLIKRLSSLPAVETFLRLSGVKVGILVHNPLRTRKSLYVDSEGFKLERRDAYKSDERDKKGQLAILDEAELHDMLQRPSPFAMDADFVHEFAHLKPGKIVDHFTQALSKPINIK